MAYVGAGQNKYTVFPLENYTFGNKAPKVEKQRNLEARFKHLRDKYASVRSSTSTFYFRLCLMRREGLAERYQAVIDAR
jgi:hypothetical protein